MSYVSPLRSGRTQGEEEAIVNIEKKQNKNMERETASFELLAHGLRCDALHLCLLNMACPALRLDRRPQTHRAKLQDSRQARSAAVACTSIFLADRRNPTVPNSQNPIPSVSNNLTVCGIKCLSLDGILKNEQIQVNRVKSPTSFSI